MFARYLYFNEPIEEITGQEFKAQLHEVISAPNPQNKFTTFNNGATYRIVVYTDGMEYISVSSQWNDGWQGETHYDEFFCKRKTLSKKEQDEIRAIFVQPPTS